MQTILDKKKNQKVRHKQKKKVNQTEMREKKR